MLTEIIEKILNTSVKSFQEYLNEQQNKPSSRPWHGKKSEIIQMWQNLKPSPIMMRPVEPGHKGTRFRNDGIRITGSSEFINSVLARFKDILAYDNQPNMSLDVEYRLQTSGKQGVSMPSYAFYVYLEQDEPKKPKLRFS